MEKKEIVSKIEYLKQQREKISSELAVTKAKISEQEEKNLQLAKKLYEKWGCRSVEELKEKIEENIKKVEEALKEIQNYMEGEKK